MSDAKIDNELLLRIAEGLDTAGASYRDVKADLLAMRQDITAMRGELSSNTSSVESAHARLKGIELTINGAGQDMGVKTRLELIDKDIQSLKSSVDDFGAWRNNLSASQIEELKSDSKTSRTFNVQMMLTIAALGIAFASMIASCGPQIARAWSPTPVKAMAATKGDAL